MIMIMKLVSVCLPGVDSLAGVTVSRLIQYTIPRNSLARLESGNRAADLQPWIRTEFKTHLGVLQKGGPHEWIPPQEQAITWFFGAFVDSVLGLCNACHRAANATSRWHQQTASPPITRPPSPRPSRLWLSPSSIASSGA
jgi:hypothetical protein